MRLLSLLIVVLTIIFTLACGADNTTPVPTAGTPAASLTAAQEATAGPTDTPGTASTSSPTPEAVATPTASAAPAPRVEPTPVPETTGTRKPTPGPTATFTPAPSPTATPTPVATRLPTRKASPPSRFSPTHTPCFTIPLYRHDYAVDLLREFPRLPLYPDFHHWTEMGQQLLDLHIGFESADPYPLERNERKDVDPTRAILRANKEQGTITLDERTTLVGIPAKAWEYRLGSRSALEWVLDQYKERKPRDPTIAAKFNTYKFADYKEQLIDLLRRVCTVSVETMEIIDMMHQKEK